MKLAEGADVIEDMTEADYMKQVVAERLASLNIATTVVEVDSGVGDQVMDAGAQKAAEMVDLVAAKISVVSNAGAWVQNAGQFRRAVRKVGGPEFDRDGRQLFAVSDSFPLGTGAEPASTHQNPFSAAGQIVRNLQELVKQL